MLGRRARDLARKSNKGKSEGYVSLGGQGFMKEWAVAWKESVVGDVRGRGAEEGGTGLCARYGELPVVCWDRAGGGVGAKVVGVCVTKRRTAGFAFGVGRDDMSMRLMRGREHGRWLERWRRWKYYCDSECFFISGIDSSCRCDQMSSDKLLPGGRALMAWNLTQHRS